jgi:hypothetical protein
LELLGYGPPGRAANGGSPNDLVTDWITLAVVAPAMGPAPSALRDPDGHRLILVNQDAGRGVPA